MSLEDFIKSFGVSLSCPGDSLPHLSPSGTCRFPCLKWDRFAPVVCWGDGGSRPFQGRETLLCLWSFVLQRERTSRRNASALGRAKGGRLGGTEQAELPTGGSVLSCGSRDSWDTCEVLSSLVQNRGIAVASLCHPLPPGEEKALCCRAGTRHQRGTSREKPQWRFPSPREL